MRVCGLTGERACCDDTEKAKGDWGRLVPDIWDPGPLDGTKQKRCGLYNNYCGIRTSPQYQNESQ